MVVVLTDSLEELLSFWCLFLLCEERLEPINDLLTSLIESHGISVLWSVQLGAVTATVAVTDLADDVETWAALSLSGPLPRIFTTVGKEDVRRAE